MNSQHENNNDLYLGVICGLLMGCGLVVLVSYMWQEASPRNTPSWLVKFKTERDNKIISKKARRQADRILAEECSGYFVRKKDRNGDGKVDIENVVYDKELVEILEDINYDGTFETETIFDNTVRLWTEVDTDGDSYADMEIHYLNDIPSIEILKDNETGTPIKIKKLAMGKVVASNLDTDRDGELDTAYAYDAIEEIKSSYRLDANPEKRIDY